jgi:hypothetical protein
MKFEEKQRPNFIAWAWLAVGLGYPLRELVHMQHHEMIPAKAIVALASLPIVAPRHLPTWRMWCRWRRWNRSDGTRGLDKDMSGIVGILGTVVAA